MRELQIDEERIHSWLPQGRRWPETPMCFATNCFLARREWFVSENYMRYFRAVDAAGGFFWHRWGDACVHMLAVAMLMPREATLKLVRARAAQASLES